MSGYQNVDYTQILGNDVLGTLECQSFNKPFSNRKETEKVLLTVSEKTNSTLIAIDGSEFTSNIKLYNENSNINSGVNFLESGTDGVIYTGLNKIESTQFGVKSELGIILGVADCCSIIGSADNGNTMFNIHAGYKGLLGNPDKKDLGIIFNLFNNLDSIGLHPTNIDNIHLSPMAGSDFELPVDFFNDISYYFFEIYKLLKKDEYFIINPEKQTHGFLDLRKLITDVLRYHCVNSSSITASNIVTTDPNNLWPSFRLHTQSKIVDHKNFGIQLDNRRLSSKVHKVIKK